MSSNYKIIDPVVIIDGPGSNLDADTVDGQHASDFATSSQGALADSALQEIADGSITETQLSTSVNASLDLADSAIQQDSFANIAAFDMQGSSLLPGQTLEIRQSGADVVFQNHFIDRIEDIFTDNSAPLTLGFSDRADETSGALRNTNRVTLVAPEITGLVNTPSAYGTQGQALVVNAAGDALQWSDISTDNQTGAEILGLLNALTSGVLANRLIPTLTTGNYHVYDTLADYTADTTTIWDDGDTLIIRTDTPGLYLYVGTNEQTSDEITFADDFIQVQHALTATAILAALLSVDGTGSNLDADLLDGLHATAFATAAQGALADSALQSIAAGTITEIELNTSVNDSLDLADSALQTGDAIAGSDITDGTITEAKLNSSINASLDLADNALQSIAAGSITETELNPSVNASLDLADSSAQQDDLDLKLNIADATETYVNIDGNIVVVAPSTDVRYLETTLADSTPSTIVTVGDALTAANIRMNDVLKFPTLTTGDRGFLVTDRSGGLVTVDGTVPTFPVGTPFIVYRNSTGAFAEITGGSGVVDQIYNATSVNAQSGVAVAGAITTHVGILEIAGSDNTFESTDTYTFANNNNEFTFDFTTPDSATFNVEFTVETGVIGSFSGTQGGFRASQWTLGYRATTDAAGSAVTEIDTSVQGSHTGNFTGTFTLTDAVTSIVQNTEYTFVLTPGITGIVIGTVPEGYSIRVHESYAGAVQVRPGTRQAIDDISDDRINRIRTSSTVLTFPDGTTFTGGDGTTLIPTPDPESSNGANDSDDVGKYLLVDGAGNYHLPDITFAQGVKNLIASEGPFAKRPVANPTSANSVIQYATDGTPSYTTISGGTSASPSGWQGSNTTASEFPAGNISATSLALSETFTLGDIGTVSTNGVSLVAGSYFVEVSVAALNASNSGTSRTYISAGLQIGSEDAVFGGYTGYLRNRFDNDGGEARYIKPVTLDATTVVTPMFRTLAESQTEDSGYQIPVGGLKITVIPLSGAAAGGADTDALATGDIGYWDDSDGSFQPSGLTFTETQTPITGTLDQSSHAHTNERGVVIEHVLIGSEVANATAVDFGDGVIHPIVQVEEDVANTRYIIHYIVSQDTVITNGATATFYFYDYNTQGRFIGLTVGYQNSICSITQGGFRMRRPTTEVFLGNGNLVLEDPNGTLVLRGGDTLFLANGFTLPTGEDITNLAVNASGIMVEGTGGGGGFTTEQIQDIVGAMFTGNTETGIFATYRDEDGTIDLQTSGEITQITTSAPITGGAVSGTANIGFAGLTGEVTATTAGVTTIGADAVDGSNIADDSIDISHLSASGTPSDSTYLRGDNTWQSITPGGTYDPSTASIGEFSDVDLTTTPTSGQVLAWNATDGEFQPADQTGGGISEEQRFKEGGYLTAISQGTVSAGSIAIFNSIPVRTVAYTSIPGFTGTWYAHTGIRIAGGTIVRDDNVTIWSLSPASASTSALLADTSTFNGPVGLSTEEEINDRIKSDFTETSYNSPIRRVPDYTAAETNGPSGYTLNSTDFVAFVFDGSGEGTVNDELRFTITDTAATLGISTADFISVEIAGIQIEGLEINSVASSAVLTGNTVEASLPQELIELLMPLGTEDSSRFSSTVSYFTTNQFFWWHSRTIPRTNDIQVDHGLTVGGTTTLSSPGFTLPTGAAITNIGIDADGNIVEGSNGGSADLSVLNTDPLRFSASVAVAQGAAVTWEDASGISFNGNADDVQHSSLFDDITTASETGSDTGRFQEVLIEEVPLATYTDWITSDVDIQSGFIALQELSELGRIIICEIDEGSTVNGSTASFRDVTLDVIEERAPTSVSNQVTNYTVTNGNAAEITSGSSWNVIEIADARRTLTHIVQEDDETVSVTTDMTVNRQLNVASINPSRGSGETQFNVFTDEGDFTTSVIPIADTTTLRFSDTNNGTIQGIFDGIGEGEGELFCTLQDTSIAAQETITETGVGNIYRVTAAGLGGVTVERSTLIDGSGFTEATGANLTFTFFTGIQTTANRVLFPGDVEFLGSVFGIDEAAVDQTYDATSIRAQSGTAVAEAVATISNGGVSTNPTSGALPVNESGAFVDSEISQSIDELLNVFTFTDGDGTAQIIAPDPRILAVIDSEGGSTGLMTRVDAGDNDAAGEYSFVTSANGDIAVGGDFTTVATVMIQDVGDDSASNLPTRTSNGDTLFFYGDADNWARFTVGADSSDNSIDNLTLVDSTGTVTATGTFYISTSNTDVDTVIQTFKGYVFDESPENVIVLALPTGSVVQPGTVMHPTSGGSGTPTVNGLTHLSVVMSGVVLPNLEVAVTTNITTFSRLPGGIFVQLYVDQDQVDILNEIGADIGQDSLTETRRYFAEDEIQLFLSSTVPQNVDINGSVNIVSDFTIGGTVTLQAPGFTLPTGEDIKNLGINANGVIVENSVGTGSGLSTANLSAGDIPYFDGANGEPSGLTINETATEIRKYSWTSMVYSESSLTAQSFNVTSSSSELIYFPRNIITAPLLHYTPEIDEDYIPISCIVKANGQTLELIAPSLHLLNTNNFDFGEITSQESLFIDYDNDIAKITEIVAWFNANAVGNEVQFVLTAEYKQLDQVLFSENYVARNNDINILGIDEQGALVSSADDSLSTPQEVSATLNSSTLANLTSVAASLDSLGSVSTGRVGLRNSADDITSVSEWNDLDTLITDIDSFIDTSTNSLEVGDRVLIYFNDLSWALVQATATTIADGVSDELTTTMTPLFSIGSPSTTNVDALTLYRDSATTIIEDALSFTVQEDDSRGSFVLDRNVNFLQNVNVGGNLLVDGDIIQNGSIINLTVDTAFDPTSTNAQAGTAVQDALIQEVVFRTNPSSTTPPIRLQHEITLAGNTTVDSGEDYTAPAIIATDAEIKVAIMLKVESFDSQAGTIHVDLTHESNTDIQSVASFTVADLARAGVLTINAVIAGSNLVAGATYDVVYRGVGNVSSVTFISSVDFDFDSGGLFVKPEGYEFIDQRIESYANGTRQDLHTNYLTGAQIGENFLAGTLTHNDGTLVLSDGFNPDDTNFRSGADAYISDGGDRVQVSFAFANGSSREQDFHVGRLLLIQFNDDQSTPTNSIIYRARVYFNNVGFPGDPVEIYANLIDSNNNLINPLSAVSDTDTTTVLAALTALANSSASGNELFNASQVSISLDLSSSQPEFTASVGLNVNSLNGFQSQGGLFPSKATLFLGFQSDGTEINVPGIGDRTPTIYTTSGVAWYHWDTLFLTGDVLSEPENNAGLWTNGANPATATVRFNLRG